LLFTAVHGELRRIAAGYIRRERLNHTLQPSALVSEAFLRRDRQDAFTGDHPPENRGRPILAGTSD